MNETTLSDAKRKILEYLKRRGPTTPGELAEVMGLTDVAIRQHLQGLEGAELVRSEKEPARGRGRPSMRWALTELANELFPDRHAELTLGLITAVRDTFGEEGLDQVIRRRAEEQVRQYQSRMMAHSLKGRVEALAQQRTEEGYMAEVIVERPGCYLLVENHCPICEAATSCVRLCGAELDVFCRVLGEDVRVERTAHMLAGDRRCAYRIQK